MPSPDTSSLGGRRGGGQEGVVSGGDEVTDPVADQVIVELIVLQDVTLPKQSDGHLTILDIIIIIIIIIIVVDQSW
jgi:hypothetical protein